MKLKQGHCVATADINEDNLQKVLSVFRASGCRVNGAFSIHNIKYFRFLEWHTDHLVKTDGVANFEMLLTAEQILGADEKPNFDFSRRPDSGKNDWYERVELPPIGVECEINWGIVSDEEKKFHEIYNGKDVKIVGHDEVTGSPVAVFRLAKDFETKPYYSLVAECFRPLKTERERAIDEMVAVIKSVPEYNDFGVAEMLYDAGFRKEGK